MVEVDVNISKVEKNLVADIATPKVDIDVDTGELKLEVIPKVINHIYTEINSSIEENQAELDIVVQAAITVIEDYDFYKGKHEFTPNKQEQIILTEDLILLQNIVIKPIPNNYGLISYNGFGITVS